MRKLYIFTNTKGDGHSGWENCLSMADDGHVLGGHLCSDVGFMYGDLVLRPDRMETLETHFSGKLDEAFEVVTLKPGEVPPDEVLVLNQKLAEQGKAISNPDQMPKVEITLSED